MATRTLIKSSTSLSVAANWGGVLPTTGDDIRIEEGNQRITDGLSALAGVNVGSVFNSSGVTFADDWQFNCTSGRVTHAGTGEMRLSGNYASILASGPGRIRVNGGTTTLAIAQTGPIDFTDQAILTTGYAAMGDMDIAAHASSRVSALYVGKSRVRTSRSIEVTNLGNGRVTFLDAATISDGSAGGIATIHGGGEIRMAGDGVTIDNIIGVFGVFNPQQCRGDITITDHAAIGLQILAGSDGSYPGGSLTFTNPASPSAPGVIPAYTGGGFFGLGG